MSCPAVLLSAPRKPRAHQHPQPKTARFKESRCRSLGICRQTVQQTVEARHGNPTTELGHHRGSKLEVLLRTPQRPGYSSEPASGKLPTTSSSGRFKVLCSICGPLDTLRFQPCRSNICNVGNRLGQPWIRRWPLVYSGASGAFLWLEGRIEREFGHRPSQRWCQTTSGITGYARIPHPTPWAPPKKGFRGLV